MQFKELKVGQEFTFEFDKARYPEWKYRRVGFDRIVCLSAPRFYGDSVGSIHVWKDQHQKVKAIEND